MRYIQLQFFQRQAIETYLGQGETMARISRILKVHRSTVKREIDRNGGKEAYSAITAHQKSCVRQSESNKQNRNKSENLKGKKHFQYPEQRKRSNRLPVFSWNAGMHQLNKKERSWLFRPSHERDRPGRIRKAMRRYIRQLTENELNYRAWWNKRQRNKRIYCLEELHRSTRDCWKWRSYRRKEIYLSTWRLMPRYKRKKIRHRFSTPAVHQTLGRYLNWPPANDGFANHSKPINSGKRYFHYRKEKKKRGSGERKIQSINERIAVVQLCRVTTIPAAFSHTALGFLAYWSFESKTLKVFEIFKVCIMSSCLVLFPLISLINQSVNRSNCVLWCYHQQEISFGASKVVGHKTNNGGEYQVNF